MRDVRLYSTELSCLLVVDEAALRFTNGTGAEGDQVRANANNRHLGFGVHDYRGVRLWSCQGVAYTVERNHLVRNTGLLEE